MLGAKSLATLSESERPELSGLPARLVRYALEELGRVFVVKDLHQAIKSQISKQRLSNLARGVGGGGPARVGVKHPRPSDSWIRIRPQTAFVDGSPQCSHSPHCFIDQCSSPRGGGAPGP
jgi:hypothetical protein